MKGRRQKKAYEYLKWLKQCEREVEALERLWELGVIKWRDERQYYSEVEPYYSDMDFGVRIDALRIIR